MRDIRWKLEKRDRLTEPRSFVKRFLCKIEKFIADREKIRFLWILRNRAPWGTQKKKELSRCSYDISHTCISAVNCLITEGKRWIISLLYFAWTSFFAVGKSHPWRPRTVEASSQPLLTAPSLCRDLPKSWAEGWVACVLPLLNLLLSEVTFDFLIFFF